MMRYGCARAQIDCEFCSRRATHAIRDPAGQCYRCCALCHYVAVRATSDPWNDHRACNGARHSTQH